MITIEFPYSKFADGTLTVPLQPATPIGGWNTQFTVMHRFGGVSGYFTKSMASGRYNVSGMDIVNSGQGIMSVTINSVDTSGMEYGCYACTLERLDSGFRTPLTEGYLILTP